MLESFIYTHTEITNSFYVVQSKMIIQSNLVVYYSWFIAIFILSKLYKFFPKLIDFSVPVFFSRQVHVLFYSII